MTKICCVCQRIEQGEYWKDENDYVFASNERVTHGYCPLCFDVVMSDLMEYIGETDPQAKEAGVVADVGDRTSVCV